MADIKETIKLMLQHDKPLLFMKGSPDQPFCRFSRQIVDILSQADIDYDSFDILQNEELRQALKEYSDWPTYPQLYSKGILIGGVDIVRGIFEEGGAQGLREAIENPDTAIHETEAYKQTMAGSVPFEKKFLMRQNQTNNQMMTVIHVDLVDDYEKIGLTSVGSVLDIGKEQLGLETVPVDDLKAENAIDVNTPPGCQVKYVAPDSYAARAGFREGDVIYGIGAEVNPVENIETLVYNFVMDRKALKDTPIHVHRLENCCATSPKTLVLKLEDIDEEDVLAFEKKSTLCNFCL